MTIWVYKFKGALSSQPINSNVKWKISPISLLNLQMAKWTSGLLEEEMNRTLVYTAILDQNVVIVNSSDSYFYP